MRILIVDDHQAVAEAFAPALSREHEVAGVLADFHLVGSWLAGHSVDIVLLDGTLPQCNLADLIRSVRIASPKSRVIVMTCDPHGDDWPALRRMGAWGFVSKTLPLDPFSQTFVEAATRENRADDGDKALKHLSPSSRQLDLLHAMARGGNRHRIAAELHLTPPWIDDLIHELKKKLGDGNWAYLVLRAIEEGWIEPRVPPPESIPTSPLRPSPAPAHL